MWLLPPRSGNCFPRAIWPTWSGIRFGSRSTARRSWINTTRNSDGLIQGYHGQAAVGACSQVIVARELTQSAADVNALVALVRRIRENTGRQADELSADAGYEQSRKSCS